MAKKILTPVQKKRQQVLQEMTPALKKVAANFDTKMTKAAVGNLTIAYNIGKIVTNVLASETKYGANAVEQLAAYMGHGWSATKLYAYRDLASEYTEAKIKQLARAKMADGGHVTVSHCLAIIKVKGKAERQKLWRRAFDEGLSAESLKMEIAATEEKRNTRSGGRKPSVPKSVMGGAQEIFNLGQKINNKFEIWDEHVTGEVMQKPATEINDALVEKLSAAESQLESMEDKLMTYRPKLQKAIDRAQKILAENKKAAAQEKASQTRVMNAGPSQTKKKVTKKKSTKKKVVKKKTTKK